MVHQMKARWERPFTEPEIYKIFQSVCEAVAQLHMMNPPIAHRDLKVCGTCLLTLFARASV